MTVVRMLYFAAIRDLMGVVEETLELPDSVRLVSDLAEHLETARPSLRGKLQGVRIALNETFADGPEPLHAGDVVALIPPVAGG